MNRSAALILLRASRDWRPLAIALVVSALAALLLGRTSTSFSSFLGFYGPLGLAIALIGGPFEFSQRGSVWLLVAQRPGTEIRRLWSILGFAAAAYFAASAVLLSGILGGLAMNADASGEGFRAALLEMPLWFVMVGFAVSLTSTLAAARSAALSIGWILSPFVLTMVQRALGFSDSIHHAIAFFLPPFEAVFQFGAVLQGDFPEHARRFTLQLIWFPILCLLLLHWRIAVLATPDRLRRE